MLDSNGGLVVVSRSSRANTAAPPSSTVWGLIVAVLLGPH